MIHNSKDMTAARLIGILVLSSAAVATAQAPLGNDTWHRVVFENPPLRILSVNVPAGTSTTEHRHDFDIVTVSMNEGTETRTQTTGQAASARPARPLGDVAITNYTGAPLSHRIENVGKRAYQLFAVENRKPNGWSATPAAAGPVTKLLQETRAFRIYDVNLAGNNSTTDHTHAAPTVALLIGGKVMSDGPDAQAKAFTPAPVGLRQLDTPGQWMIVPAGDRHHLVRLGTSDTRLVEIELR